MATYKLSGFLDKEAIVLVFNEADWSIEKVESLPAGNFIIDGLVDGVKTIVGRRQSDGVVEVYGNIITELSNPDSFLQINDAGDLLLINTSGDFLVAEAT